MRILSKITSIALLSLLLFFQLMPTGWAIFGTGDFGTVEIEVKNPDEDVAAIMQNINKNPLFDINNMMDDVEKRYHLNKESLQNLGEGMNVSDEKKTVPETTLFFTPTSPVPGEDITATANPLYFNTDKDRLYFTWFLKHDVCDKGGSSDKKTLRYCDLDGDGNIDENDWKIEGMRTIANGGFDWESGEYEKNPYQEDGDGFNTENLFGGDQGYQKGANAYCYAQDPEEGILYELAKPSSDKKSAESECEHYFPDAPGTVGNGSFGRTEEKFWHTDPYDPDTAGTSHPDEANVVGLGRNSLTWKYAVGDKVGVIVEGVSSVPTKHDNSSYAIMWAMPKKTCSLHDKDKEGYTKNIKQVDVTIPTATQDLNECITENLIDPREGGQTERMKSSLIHSPKFVSNDASADAFGDTLTITSSVENTEASPKTLKYEWKIYINKDGSYDPRGFSTDTSMDTSGGGENKWIDITRFLRINNLIPTYTGNGISDIPITLNITSSLLKNYTGKKNPSDTKDPYTEEIKKLRTYRNEGGTSIFGGTDTNDKIGTAYLKATVKISEKIDITGRNAVEGNKRTSSATIVVPISRLGDNQIIVKKVTVNKNNKLSIKQVEDSKKSLIDAIICNERSPKSGETENYNYLGIGRNLCLVVKNEIFNLFLENKDDSLKNFQWTLNGEPLTCTSDMAETNTSPVKPLCDDNQETNTTFLPVTQDAGEIYDINVSALDSTTGKRISVSRAFKVIDPYAAITSKDKAKVWQKYLGYYKKTDAKDGKVYAYENLSTEKFQAFPETTASLKASFPSGLKDRCRWQWRVNGTVLSDKNNVDEVTMLLTGNPGTVHTFTVDGYCVEDGKIRNALSQFWNASVLDTTEKRFSTTIEIEIVQNEEEENALASPKSFFAAIAKNAPAQILFTLELFLSVFVLITILSLIFSIGTREES